MKLRVHGKGTWAEPIAVLDEHEEQIAFRREMQASRDRAAIAKALLGGSPLELATAIIKTQLKGEETAKQHQIDCQIQDYFDHALKMRIGRDYFHPRREPDYSLPGTLPLPAQFLLYGVDLLSTNQIRCLLLPIAGGIQQIYWIDDSTCKITLASPEHAHTALAALLLPPSSPAQDPLPRDWMELKSYTVYSLKRRLFIRHATSLEQDIPKVPSDAYARFEVARTALPRALLLKFNALSRFNSVKHQLEMEQLALSRSNRNHRERTRDKDSYQRHPNKSYTLSERQNHRRGRVSPNTAFNFTSTTPNPYATPNPHNTPKPQENFSLSLVKGGEGMAEEVKELSLSVTGNQEQSMSIEAIGKDISMIMEAAKDPLMNEAANQMHSEQAVREEQPISMEVEKEAENMVEEKREEIEVQVDMEIEQEVKVPLQQPPQAPTTTINPLNIQIINLDSDSEEQPQPQPLPNPKTTQKPLPPTLPPAMVPGKLFKTFSDNKVEESKPKMGEIFDLDNSNASPINEDLFTQIWNKSKPENKAETLTVKQPTIERVQQQKVERKEERDNSISKAMKEPSVKEKHKEIETQKKNQKEVQHSNNRVSNTYPTEQRSRHQEQHQSKESKFKEPQQIKEQTIHQNTQQKPPRIQQCNQDRPKYNERNDRQNDRQNDRHSDRPYQRPDRQQDRTQQQRQDRPQFRNDRQQERPQQGMILKKKAEKDDDAKSDISSY